MGQPAARVTDMHTCPLVDGVVPHVGGPILPPAAITVLTGGLPQARVGDLCTCVGPPDAILMGAFNVLVCGQPAARMGDMTVHGGVIVIGLPTVLIGMDAGGVRAQGAPPPSPGTGAAGGAGPSPEQDALAKQLVSAGGSGTAADAAAVAKQVALLPLPVLKMLKLKGIKIVACRGSLTDYRTDMKGVRPRGWPPGATWDKVPGAYMPDRKEVVIATTGADISRRVPATGEGHGSYSLTDHETMHGYDAAVNGSSSPAFVAARNQDSGALNSYLSQPGVAGQQETYAESAARYYGGDPSMQKSMPNLYNYWKSQPTH